MIPRKLPAPLLKTIFATPPNQAGICLNNQPQLLTASQA